MRPLFLSHSLSKPSAYCSLSLQSIPFLTSTATATDPSCHPLQPGQQQWPPNCYLSSLASQRDPVKLCIKLCPALFKTLPFTTSFQIKAKSLEKPTKSSRTWPPCNFFDLICTTLPSCTLHTVATPGSFYLPNMLITFLPQKCVVSSN